MVDARAMLLNFSDKDRRSTGLLHVFKENIMIINQQLEVQGLVVIWVSANQGSQIPTKMSSEVERS